MEYGDILGLLGHTEVLLEVLGLKYNISIISTFVLLR